MQRSTLILMGVLGGCAFGLVGAIIGSSAGRLGAKRTWRLGVLVCLACLVFDVILVYLGSKEFGFKYHMLVGPVTFLAILIWSLTMRKHAEEAIERAINRSRRTKQQ